MTVGIYYATTTGKTEDVADRLHNFISSAEAPKEEAPKAEVAPAAEAPKKEVPKAEEASKVEQKSESPKEKK